MTILIHATWFKWTSKGAPIKVKDTNIFDDKSLQRLGNYEHLPKAGTINNVGIDADRNEWIYCGGYDNLHGLYLLEWDGAHVRKNL